MKLPIQFTNSYLKNVLSTNEIVQALERTEVEVEEIMSSVEIDKKIITAKVLNVSKHPDADRLRIAQVEFNNVQATVVCGAPNLVEGLIVVYAQPGTILPDGTKIEKATIRGEKSAGMLCSAKELGISDDHTGILELDPGLPLGISLCDIENTGDTVDIKTPANRWDMLSVLGLAREISANSLNNQIKEPKVAEIIYKNREAVKVKETGECLRFISLKLSVKQDSTTPQWLVDNLLAAGIRPIHPVVDISNFVMLETGQPSHSYDAHKIAGSVEVRFAKKDEELTTLDGTARKLNKSDLIIADSSGAIALAGVMGGKSTEVDEKTTDIMVEIAHFNKTTVRKSALLHGIRTEASARFEKGLPLPLQDFATKRLLYLLSDICQAKVIDGPFDQLYSWPWIQHIGLRVRVAEKFLGMKLDEKSILDGLHKRGFEAEHFSITKEARKHLGKPYKWGANFKQDGSAAFDCGYLIDYIYSLIGQMVGHQCLQLFEAGKEVDVSELKPGDVVFRDGPWIKLKKEERKGLSHAALYIGNGKIIHAADTVRGKKGEWVKLPKNEQIVREDSVEIITEDPDFRGARRYVDSFNHTIAVTCPWWRTDVRIEQDLFEEIAKIVSYENLPASLPSQTPTDTVKHQLVSHIQALREDLVAKGLFEIMTYSFVGDKHLELTGADKTKHLRIINPLSVEQEYLRNSLLASHIQVLAQNRNYSNEPYGYFEFSRVYLRNDKAKNSKIEQWRLAVSMVGEDSTIHLKNIIDMIFQKYQLHIKILPNKDKNYVTGRYAHIESNGSTINTYGQISTTLLHKYKIRAEMSFAEIQIDKSLFENQVPPVKIIPKYQYIQRDITLELDNIVWWQQILDQLTMNKNIVKFEFLDEFNSKVLQESLRKRLSFRLWLDCGEQPDSKTINTIVEKIATEIIRVVPGKVKIC